MLRIVSSIFARVAKLKRFSEHSRFVCASSWEYRFRTGTASWHISKRARARTSSPLARFSNDSRVTSHLIGTTDEVWRWPVGSHLASIFSSASSSCTTNPHAAKNGSGLNDSLSLSANRSEFWTPL